MSPTHRHGENHSGGYPVGRTLPAGIIKQMMRNNRHGVVTLPVLVGVSFQKQSLSCYDENTNDIYLVREILVFLI